MTKTAPRLGAFALDIDHPIGRGSMGSVWRAVHERSGLPVAVKVLTNEWSRDPRARRYFAAEVTHVAALDHPHIVRVIDRGEAAAQVEDITRGEIPADSPWLAMELARGSLRDRPPQDWGAVHAITRTLLDALAHAHARRVIHCDLKPDNVLMGCGTGDLQGLRLADFGLALHDPRAERVAGSPSYMAPEQFENRDIGPWTDLYGLACTVWEWVTGAPPFLGTLEQIRAAQYESEPPPFRPTFAVPPGLDAWLRWLLSKAKEDRPAFAADALHALHGLGPPAVQGGLAPLPVAPSDLHTASTWILDDHDEPDPKTGKSGGAVTTNRDTPLASPHRRRVRPRPPVPERWSRPPNARPDLMTQDAGLGLLGAKSPELMGRDPERDAIWSVLRKAARGSAQALVLRGPTGAGTRGMSRWAAERAHEVGAAFAIVARTAPEHRHSALALAVTRTLGCTASMTREEAGAWLSRKLRDLGPHEPWLAQALVQWRFDHKQPAGPVLVHALRTLTRTRAVVLTLEGAQWNEPDVEAIGWLLDSASVDPLPVLVLLAVQDDAATTSSAMEALLARPGVRVLALGPLQPEDQEAYLTSLLPLEPSLVNELVQRAEGNPGVAITLLQTLAAQGGLRPGPLGFGRVEGTSLLTRRDDPWIELLLDCVPGPDALEMQALERGAALGMDLPFAIWQGALRGWDPTAVAGELARRGLLTRTRVGWRFSQELVRSALEHHARTHGRWRVHHEACAQVSRLAVDPGRIGMHWLEAGQPRRALPLLMTSLRADVKAGRPRRAELTLSALRRAAAWLEIPADDPIVGEIELRQAQVRLALGQPGGVVDAMRAVLAQAQQHQWPFLAEVQLELSAALRVSGQVSDALEPVSLAAREPAHRVAALLSKARSHLLLGELEQADVTYRLIEALGELLNARERTRLRLGQALLALRRRKLQGAERWLDIAWESVPDVDHPVTLAEAHICRASILRAQGRMLEAVEAWSGAFAHATHAGSRMTQIDALVGLGDAQRSLGNLTEAENVFMRAANLARRTGGAAEVPTLNLALVRLDLGDAPGAIELAHGMSASPILDVPVIRITLNLVLLRGYATLQDWESADHYVAQLEALDPIDDDDLGAQARAATWMSGMPAALQTRVERLADAFAGRPIGP